jgi:DNA replication and repair protein RecF
MGKTNLLDAIYYLSFCKSHVYASEGAPVHHREDLMVLQGLYDFDGRTEDIFCSIRRGHRKQFKRNQKTYDKLSEHIGLLPLVMVSPDDSELIRGGSDERRKLLDMIISQYDKSYLHALIQYNKALMQRNLLLREQQTDRSLFEVLEMQMGAYGKIIYEKRECLAETLTPFFNEYYQIICQSSETVELKYISQLRDEKLEDMLAARREREYIVGHTLAGIHKDDLEMTLDNRLIRHTGSQGQNKTYLIALKLAQFMFLATQGNTKPILLLDDIFDKLDAERVEQIIQLVSSERFGQIFLTDTNRKYLDRILSAMDREYTLFKVEQGEILPMTKEP